MILILLNRWFSVVPQLFSINMRKCSTLFSNNNKIIMFDCIPLNPIYILKKTKLVLAVYPNRTPKMYDNILDMRKNI